MADEYDINDGYELIAIHALHNGVFDKRLGNFSFVVYKNEIPYKFKRCVFDNVDFTRADLTGALFNKCIFKSCKFDDVQAEGSRFTRCAFNTVSFVRALIKNGLFNNGRYDDVDFTKSFADGVIFDESYFKKGQFMDASLIGSSFKNCHLKNAVFTKSKAPGTDFTMANMTGARLAYGTFTSSKLWGTILEYADLRRGDFRSARFDFVVGMERTIRNGADFYNADINEKYMNTEY